MTYLKTIPHNADPLQPPENYRGSAEIYQHTAKDLRNTAHHTHTHTTYTQQWMWSYTINMTTVTDKRRVATA